MEDEEREPRGVHEDCRPKVGRAEREDEQRATEDGDVGHHQEEQTATLCGPHGTNVDREEESLKPERDHYDTNGKLNVYREDAGADRGGGDEHCGTSRDDAELHELVVVGAEDDPKFCRERQQRERGAANGGGGESE